MNTEWSERVDLVRPYLVTNGRTRPDGADLPLEALVSTTSRGMSAAEREQFERRPVLKRCERPLSVAEVASAIGVPLGVARVIVADLVGDGLLQVHEASEADSQLLRRLIDGVRNL